MLSNRNKQHYRLLPWEEWRAARRRGRPRCSFLTSLLKAAANSHVQKGAVLGFCLSQGPEGLVRSSSQVEAFCTWEVADSSHNCGTNL